MEKPNRATASKFLNSNRYLWNSGIFVFKCSVILAAIKEYYPVLYRKLNRFNAADIYSPKLLTKIYSRLEAVSIDYGVMEKAENIYTVLGDFFWDDFGSWASMERVKNKDKAGNIVIGEHGGLDTRDNTIIGEHGHLIATLGIADTIIVHTRDATLICAKNRVEDVKKLVKKLDPRYR